MWNICVDNNGAFTFTDNLSKLQALMKKLYWIPGTGKVVIDSDLTHSNSTINAIPNIRQHVVTKAYVDRSPAQDRISR